MVPEATIFCTGAAAKGNNIPLRRRQHDNIYCSVSNSSIHSDLSPPPALSEDYPDSSPSPLPCYKHSPNHFLPLPIPSQGKKRCDDKCCSPVIFNTPLNVKTYFMSVILRGIFEHQNTHTKDDTKRERCLDYLCVIHGNGSTAVPSYR